MASVFSSVISFAAIPNVEDAEQQLSSTPHGSLSPEQKEKKKIAKRIIKALQPLCDDAMRKESDLAGRPFERETPNLEALLEQKLRAGHGASARNVNVQKSVEADTSAAAEGEHQEQNEAANGARQGANKGNDFLHLAPTPEENSDDRHITHDAEDDEAGVAQLGQDATHINGHPEPDAMEVDTDADGRAAPPTPPGSDQDLLGPIHYGGIPWYMKEFDPEGTTVYEERWTGREVLRDMSEELSELDDDELNDLADPDSLMPPDGAAPETTVSESLQKAAARKQKKRSRYR